MASIFISHSSLDRPEAEELAGWLGEQKLHSYFLDFDPERGLIAGRRWEDELYRNLRGSAAMLVAFTPNWLASPWCFAEAAIARSEGKPVIFVELKPAQGKRVFSDTQHVDATGDPTQAKRLLARSLKELGIAETNALAYDATRSPYPGAAFREEDAAVFFGRDDEVRATIERLDSLRKPGRQKVVLLVGASGSGKSSLMRAGILSRLAQPARSDDWLTLTPFEPGGADPFHELALRIRSKLGGDREVMSVKAFEDEGSLDAFLDLVDELRGRAGRETATILIAVDQGEQLLVSDNEAALKFLQFLAKLSLRADRRVMVLITLRSDFLNVFQTRRELEGTVFELRNVAPLSSRMLPVVIERPALLAGVAIEPGLVPLMIQDAASGDALPLVAFVLRLMYDRLAKPDRTFRIKDYEAIGGVKGAVRTVAERALNSANLDPAQMAALKRALVPGLVDLGADGRYTGRPALFERLPQSAQHALEELIDARLLISDLADGRRTVRIAHDALFEEWAFLHDLLAENKDFLEARNRVERAADLWRNDGSDPTRLLPRGRSLAEASDILATHRDELSDPLVDFIRRSEARAVDELEEAKRQRDRAQANYLVAKAETTAAKDPTLAFGLSKAALHLDESAGARDTLLRLYREETFRKTVCRCSGVVRSVAFTGDDDSLLIGDDGGELRAVNWRNGRSNILWKAARGITSVAVSPDLSLVAVANGNEVQLLHPDGGLGPVLAGHQDGVTEVTFSPDSQVVLTGSADKSARLWMRSGEMVKSFPFGESNSIWSVAFSPKGTHVLLGDTVQMFLLDLEGESAGKFPLLQEFFVKARWSPDGTTIVCNNGASILAYDLSTGKPNELKSHDGTVSELAFSRLGGLIAAALNPSSQMLEPWIELWNRAGERVQSVRSGSPGFRAITALGFSRGGQYLAFAVGQTVYVSELFFEPVGQYALTQSKDPVTEGALAASPKHSAFAVVAGSNIELWNLSGERAGAFEGHAAAVYEVAWSSDGQRLITASADKTARIWNLNGDPPRVLQHEAEVFSAAFHENGELIVTGAKDGSIWLATPSRAMMRVQVSPESPVIKVGFVPGQDAIAAAQGNTVSLWSLQAKRLCTIEFPDFVDDFVLSIDGKYLWSRSWKACTIHRVDLTERQTSLFRKTTYAPDTLAISPDGRWIGASDGDTLNVWSADGEEYRRIRHRRCRSLAFTMDSRHLLASTYEGRVEAWPAPMTLEEFLASGHVDPLSSDQIREFGLEQFGAC